MKTRFALINRGEGGSVVILMFAISLVLTSTGFAQDSSVQQLVSDLKSPEFLTRSTAQQQLTTLANTDPEQLTAMALEADPEVLLRILKVLELTFLNDEGELGERAEKAIMFLSDEAAPAGVFARKILINHARLRESRTRKAFEALGGEFSYINPFASDSRGISYRSLAVAPGTGVGFGPPAILQSVWLHEDWKGTPEDLWHLRRLIHCSDIALYSIKGNGMDLNDLYRLAAVIPGLSVAERGPCLGIRSTPFGGYNCEVGDVLPGSAAALAGLQRGDQIYELNGQQIRSFSHLVESLQVFAIGEVVKLSVYRGREELEIPVTLGSWRGIAIGSPDYAAPPAPFSGPLGKPAHNAYPPPVPLPETDFDSPY